MVNDLAQEAGLLFNIEVKSSFGGSGSMRERIEKGESPDVLMSADLASPRKVQAQGRTVVRLALFLLSEKGQAIIAREGLVPLADPAGT